MSKKEERLSPKAHKLLEETRRRFSTRPEKAIEYLMSVDPKELTMYDRQKVGREIVIRGKEASVLGNGYVLGKEWLDELKPTIEQDYQLTNFHPNAYEMRLGAERDEKKLYGDLGKKDRINEFARLRRMGDKRFEEAEKLENERDKTLATTRYLWAGDTYVKAGSLNQALKSYKKALEYQKDKSEVRETREKIAYIKKSEKELNSRKSKMKMSRLEKAATTTAIIGLLVGIFFLSSNLTGNAVGNLNQTSSNWIGGILFILGIIGALFYFRKR